MTRILWIALFFAAAAFPQDGKLGLFTNSGDVGSPAIQGSSTFDASTAQYRVTGSGANIWGKQDQFQFIWKEVTGNFTVTATMQFQGKGADHRKAGIMARQSLDADAAYADGIVHGNGMPALQWRSRKGEDTNPFDFPFDGPGTFRIKMVRTGVRIFLFIAKGDAEPKEVAHTEVSFQGPVLVGLAVCSHDAKASDTVVFSDVKIEVQPPPAPKVP